MNNQYYIRFRGKVQGPFSVERLNVLAQRRRFGRHFEVSTDHMNWSPATEHPELFPRRQPARPTRKGPEVQAQSAIDRPVDATRNAVPDPMADAEPELYTQRHEPESSHGGSSWQGSQRATDAQFVDVPAPETVSWYYVHGSQQSGPVRFDELQSRVASGEITSNTLVWCESLDNWIESERIPNLISGALATSGTARRSSRTPRAGRRRMSGDELGSGSILAMLCGIAFALSLPFVFVGGMNVAVVPVIAGGLAFLLVAVAGIWRVFEKAGYSGWLSLVPVANLLVLHEIGGVPKWALIAWLFPGISVIAVFILCYGVAKNFGQGAGFAIGLFFLGGIFFPILGFGDYEHDGSWSL